VAAASFGSGALTNRAVARVAPTSVPFSVLSSSEASEPTVSGSGQYVVYTSAPATDDGRTSSAWITDRADGTTSELTLPKDGVRPGNTLHPVISADGCVVVVITEMAYDLFRDDDTGERWDAYRETMPWCGGQPNDWSLVSTVISTEGQAQARGDVDSTQAPAVSSSGTVIAYARPFKSASGLDDPARHPSAIDVVDWTVPIDDPTHTVPAAGLPAELAGNSVQYAGARSPALSGDGNTLVFSSDATSNEAVPDWATPAAGATTVPSQIYAWNRLEADPYAAVQLISTNDRGAADAGAVDPAVSADGKTIAFSSSATNLISVAALATCGSSCPAQIYVVQRGDASQVMTIISREPAAPGEIIVSGNGASFTPSITSDGNTIVFATQATNLMQIQTPGGGDAGDGDLLIADLATGNLQRAFESPSPAPGAHSHPHLSANGRALVADSLVADRLLGDPSITGRHVVVATFNPTVTMSDLDVGTVSVSVPGPEWFVNVVNQGPGSFQPAGITIDNPDFALTANGSCFSLAPVAAGKSCSVAIILTPTIDGPEKATLTVAEAGYGAIVLSSAVNGAGGLPALDAEPKAADFGEAVVGSLGIAPAAFNVYNIFYTPVTVTTASLSGNDPKDFIISHNSCGVEVAIGSGCVVEISFKPTQAGRRSAVLNVSTDAGQYTSVLLAGSGRYDASVMTSPVVRPGQNLGIGGTGFPVNTDVQINWSDGTGRSTVVTTDARGNFLTSLLIPRGQRGGAKVLIASVVNGPSASAPVEILKVSSRGAGSASWAGD